MPSLYNRILVLLLIFGMFQGCTRDDLCPGETETTPRMLILFKDFEEPENRKAVEGISIETDELESRIVLGRTTTDSIALPLDVNSNTTQYKFIKTTITEVDTVVTVDKVRFVYQQNDVYVNRACGFKAEFVLNEAVLENTGNEHWIKEIIIKRDSIVDETKAHLTILH